ncbi:MAG: hypothetical protein IPG63_08030 [Xanthomonadales bacterium]|nr:hypothetical protein [Xanthomonadales bacterium]
MSDATFRVLLQWRNVLACGYQRRQRARRGPEMVEAERERERESKRRKLEQELQSVYQELRRPLADDGLLRQLQERRMELETMARAEFNRWNGLTGRRI